MGTKSRISEINEITTGDTVMFKFASGSGEKAVKLARTQIQLWRNKGATGDIAAVLKSHESEIADAVGRATRGKPENSEINLTSGDF